MIYPYVKNTQLFYYPNYADPAQFPRIAYWVSNHRRARGISTWIKPDNAAQYPPGETGVIFDPANAITLGTYATEGNATPCGTSYRLNQPPSAPYNGQGNVGFLDGHVKSFEWRKALQVNMTWIWNW